MAETAQGGPLYPAPPAGDQGLMVPPPILSFAEPLPPSPQSRNAPSQEVLEGASQADPQFSDILETSDQPKHVEVESVGVYTPDEDGESADSEFADHSAIAGTVGEEVPRFCGEGHRLPRFFAFCGSKLFVFPQCGSQHAPSEPQVRVLS